MKATNILPDLSRGFRDKGLLYTEMTKKHVPIKPPLSLATNAFPILSEKDRAHIYPSHKLLEPYLE